MSSLTPLAPSSLGTPTEGTAQESLLLKTSLTSLNSLDKIKPSPKIIKLSPSNIKKTPEKSFIVSIILITLSIVMFLAGFGLLLCGIIQVMPLLLPMGTIFVSIAVLGLLVATVLMGTRKQKENRVLEKAKRSLEQDLDFTRKLKNCFKSKLNYVEQKNQLLEEENTRLHKEYTAAIRNLYHMQPRDPSNLEDDDTPRSRFEEKIYTEQAKALYADIYTMMKKKLEQGIPVSSISHSTQPTPNKSCESLSQSKDSVINL